MNIVKTNSSNKDFINLVCDLDAYLKITDGDEHDFYNQFNNIDGLQHVVICYVDDTKTSSVQSLAVGCGAFKQFDSQTMELKRMYVKPEYRGKGFAQEILFALESWARELGYTKCVLETGKRQVEAVGFYKKCDYKLIPKYGQYAKMENSLCFEKKL